MTYNDYKALYDEYWNTDSIKRREEIEEKISKAGLALFNRVRGIFDKYHARKQLIHDSDYRDDRGWIGLAHEDDDLAMIEKDNFYLCYSDHWQYGGECCFTITINAHWFDAANRKKLAEELRKKRIEKLGAEIESLEKEISHKQELLEECIGTYNSLKAGGDPDCSECDEDED